MSTKISKVNEMSHSLLSILDQSEFYLTPAVAMRAFTQYYNFVSSNEMFDRQELMEKIRCICIRVFTRFGICPVDALFGRFLIRDSVRPCDLKRMFAQNGALWLVRTARVLRAIFPCNKSDAEWRKMPAIIVSKIVDLSICGAFSDVCRFDSDAEFFSAPTMAIQHLCTLVCEKRRQVTLEDLSIALKIWLSKPLPRKRSRINAN